MLSTFNLICLGNLFDQGKRSSIFSILSILFKTYSKYKSGTKRFAFAVRYIENNLLAFVPPSSVLTNKKFLLHKANGLTALSDAYKKFRISIGTCHKTFCMPKKSIPNIWLICWN